MNTNNNADKKDNKFFDYCKDNKEENNWTPHCLVDNIFNDLMDEKTIEDNDSKHFNKYIHQAITKFQDFRIKSPVTNFEISIADLSNETKKQLDDYVKDCNSDRKIYHKLSGIMIEAIALIYKQSEPLILSSIKYEDIAWVKKAINEIRERIKKRWRFTN